MYVELGGQLERARGENTEPALLWSLRDDSGKVFASLPVSLASIQPGAFGPSSAFLGEAQVPSEDRVYSVHIPFPWDSAPGAEAAWTAEIAV
eukprot:CAMPEP_0196774730 /NCGR_PEP_ID=MMETSP1104-20130614/3591_1 /TAXON_ID=33652 /ORGANISM="Cafeteria sp., Strain Caron Lab Isolate" /LENGTH=91 /DNA_ID=CAMNT_0042144893 /DNA_START=40 /DNA_END=312 /DNA_ORIENTATION=-